MFCVCANVFSFNVCLGLVFISAALPLFCVASLTGPGNVVAQKPLYRVIARSTLTGVASQYHGIHLMYRMIFVSQLSE